MGQRERIDAPPLLVSAKLAKALANPWRNRILLEVHLRPMSPTQFVNEFGGPDVTTIGRHFSELRRWGYLEVAEELRGGRRRGSVEKVYRAIQRVQFDTPTWEKLPRYLREECSGTILQGLIRRIARAVEAETFDVDKDRHLSWKAVYLDRHAFSEYVTRLDEVLAWLPQVEAESAERIAMTEDEPIPTTVALLAFRSPAEKVGAPTPVARSSEAKSTHQEPLFLMSVQMARALANPWRNRILIELHQQAMGPKQFSEKFGGPELPTIARYFRQLKKWGFLEVNEERRGGKRRGAVEKIYRAIRRVHFDTSIWEGLPRHLRNECSGAVLDGLIHRINQAVEAETFDVDKDRHLAWKAVQFDRLAWSAFVARLDEILAWVNKLEAESLGRVGETKQELIPVTVALMNFRAPR